MTTKTKPKFDKKTRRRFQEIEAHVARQKAAEEAAEKDRDAILAAAVRVAEADRELAKYDAMEPWERAGSPESDAEYRHDIAVKLLAARKAYAKVAKKSRMWMLSDLLAGDRL